MVIAMKNIPNIAAVIPAAGLGRRMGSEQNKIRLNLNGEPVIGHTLRTFVATAAVGMIVLAVNAAEKQYFEEYLQSEWPAEARQRIALTIGGKERQDSVYQGLLYLRGWDGWSGGVGRRLVVIHDAARALLTRAILEASIAAGWEYGAVGVAVPVKDTIKQIDAAGFVVGTPERATLRAIQTPQVFDFETILACHERVRMSGGCFSDDCGVAEACGKRVKLIAGSYENLKITTPEDLWLAETILRRRADADRARV